MNIEIIEERRADVIEALIAGVREFNAQVLGFEESKPLTVVARDGAGQVVGGVSGRTIYGHYLIEVVWVAEHLRGQGLGRRLMEQAEAKAKARGCVGSQVDTLSFQGPQFYARLGFEVIGKIAGFPFGHDRYFLLKIYG